VPGRNPNLTDHQATGSLGGILLKSLLSEPAFKVTVLTRESSGGRTSIPSAARVITTADSYPQEDLVRVFQGQDVVVNAVTSFSVVEQLKFIDAAVAAGVKRYIPSEYGLDNNNSAARELSPVFRDKGRVQDYLRLNEDTGLTWTAIACGMWIEWYYYPSISLFDSFHLFKFIIQPHSIRFSSNIWTDLQLTGPFATTSSASTTAPAR
jgi:uncharacterized protein YbjT (DUF2867 family)